MSAASGILKNWKQKLLSLIIAVALSFYVGNMRQNERIISLPLVLRNSPGFLIPVTPFPEMITIRIKANSRQLLVFDPKDISATLDLSLARYGNNTFFVELHHHRPLDQVTLIPSENSFQVFMDRVLVKTLPLTPVLINKPASGFTLDSFKLQPESVEVRGPATVLNDLQSLACRPVNIGGLNQSTERTVQPDFKGNNLSLANPVAITLSLVVAPLVQSRDFENVLLAVSNLAPDLKLREVQPARVLLKATGARTNVLELDATRLKPWLDLSGIKTKGRHTLPVRIILPAGITEMLAIPAEAVVVLE